MDTTVIRRYLQPSPTLRWHPWAPLLAGALALLFAFYFGAQWGKGAERRELWSVVDYPGRVFMDYFVDAKFPGERMMSDAIAIDSGVETFVRRSEHLPAWWEAPREKLEAFVLNTHSYRQSKEFVITMAEFRLSELSPANTRWQATSAWCARHGNRLNDFDVLGAFKDSAKAYSKLLGREVRPQELAPAVPSWTCPGSVPKESK
jgi:hypothetical protein